MSIPNLQVLERFETWKSFNESLLPFMSFKYASNPNAEFFQNRKNEHDQAFKNLTNLEKDAKNEIQIFEWVHSILKRKSDISIPNEDFVF